MSLTEPYFRLVATEVDEAAKVKHRVYVCARPTLVLFDIKTQEPLASFMFQAHGEDLSYRGYSRPQATKLANTVLYPRENDADGRQRFQGIVDQDKQFAEYVLTNLCAEGMLNINLLKENRAVREVNPAGVNQINELRPGESIKVYSDQTMGNAKMILEGVTRAVHNTKTGAVTMEDVSVGQDEAEARDKKKEVAEGTDFYLSVVPELGVASLRERFESTQWRVVDMLRLTRPFEKAPEPMAYRGFGVRGGGEVEVGLYDGAPAAPGASPPQIFGFNSQREMFMAMAAANNGSRGPVTNGGGGGGDVKESAVKGKRKMVQAESSDEEDGAEDEEEDEEGGFGEEEVGVMYEKAPAAAAAAAAARVPYTNSNVDGLADFFGAAAAGAAPKPAAAPKPDFDALARATQAAKVRAGDVADVHSAETGKEYDYERASFPCTIGLSVSVRREDVKGASSSPPRWLMGPGGIAMPGALASAIETAYQQWEQSYHHGSFDAYTWSETSADGNTSTIKSISFSKIMSGAPGVKRVAGKTRVIGGLVLSPPLSAAEEKERAATLIGEYSKQRDAIIMAQIPKTFVSEECCICLEPAPSMLFALCGHVCTCSSPACYESVQKCPVCRAHIVAKVCAQI